MSAPDASTTSAPPSERDPLLAPSQPSSQPQRHWYNTPRPLWLAPLALTAALSRGLTLAARIQALIQLTCEARIEPTLIQSPGELVAEYIAIPASCLKDPAVQASSAKLQTVLVIVMGILSALTSGLWGKWGARVGRTKVFTVTTLGLAASELVYGLLLLPNSPIRGHGHKLLLLAPVAEGLCGGWTTFQAAINAYISDTSPARSNSKLFARFMGLIYVGFALGPDFASLAIRLDASRSVTPLFFISAACYAINAIYTTLIMPDSLSSPDSSACSEHAVEPSGSESSIEENDNQSTPLISVATIKKVLAPLVVLRPRKVGALRKDYTLTWIGLAYFLYLLSLASFQLKYLYAGHVFGWDAEHLGYYISTMGWIRGFNLLMFLPMFIYFFKPRRHRDGRPPSARELLQFDLTLVRLQTGMDVISHVLVCVLPDTPSLFVLATALTSMGSGSIPAIHSTVVGYSRLRSSQAQVPESEREDVGVLFGALATIQAIGQTILGPLLFGALYTMTVDTYPKGIFAGAAVCAGLGWGVLMLVRPRKRVILVGPWRSPTTSTFSERGSPANVPRTRRGRGRSTLTKEIVPPMSLYFYEQTHALESYQDHHHPQLQHYDV